jgi:hypothetical protein
MRRIDELEERQVRVHAREHRPARDLLARGEHDAARLAVADVDVVDRRLEPDLDTGLSRRRADRLRDRARAASRDPPRAERAVDLAHVVVQQDVRGARRLHALERSDDPRGAHRRDQRVGLEPLT